MHCTGVETGPCVVPRSVSVVLAVGRHGRTVGPQPWSVGMSASVGVTDELMAQPSATESLCLF